MKTFSRYLLAKTIFAMLLVVVTQRYALAEDIDIYGNPTASGANPNLLVIIDNSSNWSSNSQHWQPAGTKQGQAELEALRTLASEFSDNINVGLMMFTPGSGGTNYSGGYLRYHIRPMNSTNKSALQELLGTSSCVDGNNSLNGTPNCIYKNFDGSVEKVSGATIDTSAALFDAFKYFGGYTSPANANNDTAGTPTDASHFGPYRYAGNPEVKSDVAAYTGGASLPQYNLGLTACAKNYIVYIGNGYPGTESPSTLLSGVGGDTTQLPLNNYTITTSTTTSTAGSTNLCYTSAASVPTSDYPIDCASYVSPDSCAVGTAIANPAVTACPAGTASYPVVGNIPAQPMVANASHSITGSVQSGNTSTYTITAPNHRFAAGSSVTISACPVGNQPSKTLNGNHVVVTSTPSSNTFTINDANNSSPACTAGTVVGTDEAVAASTVSLGYSQCASACTTADFSNLCGSTYATCSCSTPTASTTPTCSSGNKFNINATLTTTTITPSSTTYIPTGSAISYADEWARFLYRTDVSSMPGQQNIITYAIDVFKDAPDVNATALFKSMADKGGGKYFMAQDGNGILTALRTIMSEVQSVNSVFASSSLPVSVNTQGTYLNQVFIGMFRPDANGKPRWMGNLKQYKFALSGAHLLLADATGNSAVSATTGFITNCAQSFWSSDSGNYWDFTGSVAKGSCSAVTSQFPTAGSSSIYSDLPDGEVVEKGGAAQRLRGVGSSGGILTASSTNYATRALKTCDPSTCASLIDFNTANAAITQALLGVSSATDRDNLIDWVRGKDNQDSTINLIDENKNGTYAEMRPSAHGDVVHSQPGVVDFGGSTGVVTFYGDNGGVLHAINGQQTADAGNEIWGFIAPETYGRLNRLRTNSPFVNIPGVSTTLTPAPTTKDYFFDGPVSVYQNGSTVWIFPTMRRGGRAIYAFDVSTPTADGISFKWRKGCFTNSTTNDTSCSSDATYPAEWQKMGQSWSKVQIGYLSGYSTPVLVFGGGYDTCEDADSQSRCTSTPRKGANIWFVDANTGAIIRTYPTNYSVPGDVTLIKDASGSISHIYAADTGGYVYRINVGTWDGTTLGSGWTSNAAAGNITIANLSESSQARKFMNGLSVVEYASHNSVLVGSGDREHPLLVDYPCTNPVTNEFYMIKDTPPGYPSTAITASELTNQTDSATCSTTVNDKGWRFNLPNLCEQSINKAITIGGYTYFGTNQPESPVANSCATNLGIARGYAVKATTGCAPPGAGRSITFVGGGLSPSPVAGAANVDGTIQTFCLGCGTAADKRAQENDCTASLEGCKVEPNVPARRTRTYWYKK